MAAELPTSAPGRNGSDASETDVVPSQSGDAGGRWFRSTLPKLATFIVGLITLAGTAVAVLFQVDPGIAPCLSGRHASFTGAPVFPHYPYRRFLEDEGLDPRGYPNVQGAEVRYSYRVDNLRGQVLVLRMTLVGIARDGTIRAADTSHVDGNDLFRVQTIKPDQCSQGEARRSSLTFLPACTVALTST